MTTDLQTPTNLAFYKNHATEAIEAVMTSSAAAGQYIAVNYGADHPMALEHAAIWAAATQALIARKVLA